MPTKLNNLINASPTKEFFISMLVRDISLKDAICDLIDNSIDGAKSIRGENDYKGLYIKLRINDGSFEIEDNCGGIGIDTAQNYAFRFGRPRNVDALNYSVGQFGIGMKRALFKIGNKFKIESKTQSDSFVLDVNVNDWKNDIDDWHFQFSEMAKNEEREIKKTSTIISVEEIHEDIRNQFNNKSFLSELKKQIEFQNLYNINKGISITLNDEKLFAQKLNFNVSDDYKIGEYTSEIDGVSTKIYAGISEKQGDLGGWYIFCNDRLVLGPDQSKITGWGDGFARYHGQYERFRGIVFFTAADSSKLPWNTTKTGVNEDSLIYITAKQKMVELSKTVISFLNNLKAENDSDYSGSRVLSETLKNTTVVNFATANNIQQYKSEKGIFESPTPDNKRKANEDDQATIPQFKKKKEHLEFLKKFFKVSTNREVGEKSFDYVIKNEF